MRVRRMSQDGDMIFGNNQRAFFVNNADAVGQIISTRLRLNLGEWFLDTSDGTPWNSKVLGNRTTSTRDPVIQARVLGAPQVQNIVNYNSQVTASTRTFNSAMTVNTTYGVLTVTTEIPSTASEPGSGSGSSGRTFLKTETQSPYSILVQWSADPVFTMDDSSYGLLDSGNLIG